MRTATTILLAVVMLPGCAATARGPQSPPEPRIYGYRVSGNNVVFSFRQGEYASATSGATGEAVPVKDLQLTSVAVAGEFNGWSVGAWPMARSGEWWVASRPVTEFESAKVYSFKFVLNGRFWAEPPADAANRVLAPNGIANLGLEVGPPGTPSR